MAEQYLTTKEGKTLLQSLDAEILAILGGEHTPESAGQAVIKVVYAVRAALDAQGYQHIKIGDLTGENAVIVEDGKIKLPVTISLSNTDGKYAGFWRYGQ